MSLSTAHATSSDLTGSPIDEMGPIDFYLIEFPHRRVAGEGLPMLVDLVNRGIVRVLDLVFIRKEPGGTVHRVAVKDLGSEFAVFEGASSGLLDEEDVTAAGEIIGEDSGAALLVFENRWAGPFATALRRGGAQLCASARLPVQAIVAALDAAEAK